MQNLTGLEAAIGWPKPHPSPSFMIAYPIRHACVDDARHPDLDDILVGIGLALLILGSSLFAAAMNTPLPV